MFSETNGTDVSVLNDYIRLWPSTKTTKANLRIICASTGQMYRADLGVQVRMERNISFHELFWLMHPRLLNAYTNEKVAV